MSTIIDTNRGRYRVEHIALIREMIERQAGLHDGDKCPVCEHVFHRWLDHVSFEPTTKKLSGIAYYVLICDGCGFTVEDIWESKEEWEVTAQQVGE